MDFDQAFEKLIGHEGDFSDHPSDPGGRTRYGVTERVARVYGYVGDMRDLPLDTAKEIARSAYWDVVRADDLPEAVRFDVFDAAYNSGPRQAAKWLQRACGTPPDGDIGAWTVAAANAGDPYQLLAHFNGHRLAFMADLPTWGSFSKGWVRRIAENLKSA